MFPTCHYLIPGRSHGYSEGVPEGGCHRSPDPEEDRKDKPYTPHNRQGESVR